MRRLLHITLALSVLATPTISFATVGYGYGSGYDSSLSCPPGSFMYDSLSGECKCFTGEVIGSDGMCENAQLVCEQKIGYESSYDILTNSCKCNYGYALNANGQCSSDNTQHISYCFLTLPIENLSQIQNAISFSQSSLSSYQKNLNDSISQASSMSANMSTPQAQTDEYNTLVAQDHASWDAYIAEYRDCVSNYLPGQATSYCQSQEGSHSVFDTTKNECGCQQGYWYDSANRQCEEPATVCMDTLGQYSHVTSNSCVCNDYYASSGGSQCYSIKETRSIDAAVKAWLDGGGNCSNNPSFTTDQKAQCVIYEGNPDKYDWVVSNTVPAASPPAPQSTPTMTSNVPLVTPPPPPAQSPTAQAQPQIVHAQSKPKEHVPTQSTVTATTSNVILPVVPTTTPATPHHISQPLQSRSAWERIGAFFAKLNPFSWF